MIVHFRKALEWLGARANLVFFACLVLVAALWIFIKITDSVREGETTRFDEWAVRVMRRPGDMTRIRGPKLVEEVGRDMTAMGGVAVITLIIGAVVGFLLLKRKFGAMVLVIVATLGGLLLSTVAKLIMNRERPDIVPHLSQVYTSSFPSGHSMLSAAVYLTLGALLARFVEERIIKFYFIAVAVVLTFLVGLSRVLMGVHYPTDVLAGWAGGLVWAIVCWLVARYLQHRGKVEKSVDETTPSEEIVDPSANSTSGRGFAVENPFKR